MERETVVSGYCRQIDNSRMVCVEADGHELLDIDCLFPDCPHAPACPIGEKVREFLDEA